MMQMFVGLQAKKDEEDLATPARLKPFRREWTQKNTDEE